MQNWAIKQALDFATASLNEVCENPRTEARALLAFVLNKSSSWLLAWPEHTLSLMESTQFNRVIERRKRSEPLAYIIGEKEFWSLALKVNKHTLIPRADTECLVETALSLIRPFAHQNLVDLGTGSGAIALAIASEVPELHIVATDCSKEALMIAKQNALVNQLSNIEFIQSDWFKSLSKQRFSLIVSNPPYIRENDLHLQDLGLQYEPQSALVSGTEGLDDIAIIIENSVNYIQTNGYLILEHGFDQADSVISLLLQHGYSAAMTRKDYTGNDRVTYATYTAS